MFSSAQLFGQEWSEEQKEVWSAVENWWQAWADGDIDKINSCIAEGFRGWRADFQGPYTLESSQPWWERWLQKKKSPGLHHLTPVAIDIHADIVIVFYSFHAINELKDGSELNERGKWTDIYRKTDGKWLIISETGFDFTISKN
jgi:ketosteroid isomerase-like protein